MFLLGLNFVFGRFCQGRLINLLPVFVVFCDYLNVLVHSLRVLLYYFVFFMLPCDHSGELFVICCNCHNKTA